MVLPGLLALRYSKKLRAWLLYADCLYEDSTHVMITGNDAVIEIEETHVDRSGKKVFHYRKIKYFRTEDGYYPVAYSPREHHHLFNEQFIAKGLTTAEAQ